MSEFEPSGATPEESVEPSAGMPEPPVADAMAELDGLSALDLTEHPALYQRIHTELQSALSAIDDA
jgi:hypothetical protein